MQTIKSKMSFLSCEERSLQSFLSCEPKRRNQNLTTQKCNLASTLGKSLSCQNGNSLESGIEVLPSYSAKIQKENSSGQKAPLIAGIDPGITGGIAFIKPSFDGKNVVFVAVYDFPLKETLIGKRLKNRIDLEALAFLIESYSKDINLACIEEVGQIGTNADPFSSFVFGFATGSVHGILAANNINIQPVKPLIWKSVLGLDADKNKAIEKAKNLFPQAIPFLKRKKDHGRAEALLIAFFAWKMGAIS